MIMPSPLHVLLVNDQADARLALRWMLQRAFTDAVILEAPSQAEATRLSESEPTDCILLDATVTQFEAVCSVLTQHAELSHVPLIVIAGAEDHSQRDFAQQLGLERWIDKEELSSSRLRLCVRDALRESDLQRQVDEQVREVTRLKAELERNPPEVSEAALDAAFGRAIVDETDDLDDATLNHDLATPVIDEVIDEPLVIPGDESSAVTWSAPTPIIAPIVVAPQTAITQPERPKLATHVGTSTAEEQETARQLQAELMPGGSPFIEGFEIAGISLPAESTGGDYYDYLPTCDGLLNIAIGECSGRGIAPTMLVTSLRAYLRVLSAAINDPSEILSQANTLITEDIGDEEFIVTLMLVQIDQVTKRITYASAGHQGYLVQRDGESQILHSTGMPMGLRTETIIPEGPSMRLKVGEMLLLVTDGAQKMMSDSGERFGIERMLNVVRENRTLPVRMIVSLLRKACLEFAGALGQGDDITIVLVRAESSNV